MAGAGPLLRMGSLRYEKVTIFKEYLLGRGSFGAVYKAQCDDLPCAAKVLHPTLVDTGMYNRVQERFQQERMFLDSIRHPNIVLYLGMCNDPVTQQPALLMELLDESLTDMLESLTNALPYHIQVNICHDVSLAIAYLHSQHILHRDLSSNNVLMIARRKAKITDFGVSRIVDFELHSSTPLSLCPGTKVYMPPEALREPPNYTEKLDVFSFGVIVVQLLTRLFPRPTSSTQDVLNDPSGQGRRVQEIVPEKDRRKNHIDLIEPNHPLIGTILACLKDEGRDRPNASQLCQTFTELKVSLMYTESRQHDHLIDSSPRTHTSSFQWTNGDSSSDSSELKKKLYEKEKQLSQMSFHLSRQDDTFKLHEMEIEKKKAAIAKYAQKMQELQKRNDALTSQLHHSGSETQKLQEQLTHVWQSKEETARTQEQEILRFDHTIETQRKEIGEKDARIQQLNQKLKESEQLTAHFQRTLEATQQQQQRQRPSSLPSPTASSPTASSPRSLPRRCNSFDKLEMRWRNVTSVPCSLHRGTSAYYNGTVYLAFNSKVFAYSTTTQCWKQLPNCPQPNGAFVMTNEFPTMIGGERNGRVTNTLVTLMGYTSECNWIESFPKMPTARAYSSAVKCNGHVIVIGGCSSTKLGLGEGVLSVVEVLEIGEVACMWFTVSSLCHPLADASAVVYHGQVMLIGGTDKYGETFTNLKCSVKELLDTKTKDAANGHQQEGPNTRNRIGSSQVWKYMIDSKLIRSTGVVVNGHLLAIGGVDTSHKSTTLMFRYNDASNHWEKIGLMKMARSHCYVISLPNNELMVVGGNTSNPSMLTNMAEIATIL